MFFFSQSIDFVPSLLYLDRYIELGTYYKRGSDTFWSFFRTLQSFRYLRLHKNIETLDQMKPNRAMGSRELVIRAIILVEPLVHT